MNSHRKMAVAIVAFMFFAILAVPCYGEKAKSVQIELVFVLDTTGSMSGLIQGAKAKVWAIVNTIASAKPAPEIKVGLIAFRDKGDAYITQISDLSYDLDAIYAKLTKFVADGGGDGPEDVNKALVDAVDAIHWASDKSVIKMIYLVGDAPPHMDYGEETYKTVCTRAVKNWITINAIRCGGDSNTERHWRAISALADGKYTSVAQDGGMIVISTPMDGKLNALNAKLNETFVGYGHKAAERKRKMKKDEKELEADMDRGMDAPAASSAKAERISYKAKTIDASFSRAGDLVADYKKNSKILKGVKNEQLPEEMKKLSQEQRKVYLDKKVKEREQIKREILELDKKRQHYIKSEMAKKHKGNAFDAFVLETLNEVAKKRGIDMSSD